MVMDDWHNLASLAAVVISIIGGVAFLMWSGIGP